MLAGLCAGALVAASGRASAQAPLQIRISTAAPPADFLAKALDSLKDEIAKSGLGLAVETYPASALFRQGTEVPALQRGTLEMSTMTTFEVAQQIPELGFFNRGYLFRDHAHLRQVFDGPIGVEYRRAVSAKMGIEILATAYLGTRQVNLRHKRPVKTPADLAGVKMRMPAGPEWLLLGKALGVSPVPLGMPEVYLGLKTGSIDGQGRARSPRPQAPCPSGLSMIVASSASRSSSFTLALNPAGGLEAAPLLGRQLVEGGLRHGVEDGLHHMRGEHDLLGHLVELCGAEDRQRILFMQRVAETR